MADMQTFALWLLQNIPSFLLSPPISLIMGLVILLLVIENLRKLLSIGK